MAKLRIYGTILFSQQVHTELSTVRFPLNSLNYVIKVVVLLMSRKIPLKNKWDCVY